MRLPAVTTKDMNGIHALESPIDERPGCSLHVSNILCFDFP